MKHAFISIILIVSFTSTSFSQKVLNVRNLNTIPMGNELGLVRNYTNDEILAFVEISGWKSFYPENISLIPKIIARISRPALSQLHVEAKNVWYLAMQNDATEELRINLKTKYGEIGASDFKKFVILLLVLEKMDRGIKYNQ